MILLLDNRDSYTYNLAHLVAKVTGSEPLVVRCDAPEAPELPARIRAGEFSHIIISPGPGTPESDEDFGASRRAIEAAAEAKLPLLGVCLGHQGLGLLAGAPIHRAAPQHGMLSTLTHSGEGIFAGLPQGMHVVRYHSLCVVDPAASNPRLEVHARAEDGTVQALKVAGLNHWGVQFHPESILTEHGEALMRNFLGLPGPWRVARTRLEGALDTEALFRALRSTLPATEVFWLDSATGDGTTIMGTSAGSLAAVFDGAGSVDKLSAQLQRGAVGPIPGGLVGYCAYARTPGAGWWLRPHAFVVYHHDGAVVECCVLVDEHETPETERLMQQLIHAVRTAQATATPRPHEAVPIELGTGAWQMDKDTYLGRIADIKEALARGDSYEVCLTDTWETTITGSGLDAYCRLRRANPAPYAAYLDTGTEEVLCSSPERFLRVRGGIVSSKPIKGTIAREEDPAILRQDVKTRAENLMIVDLLRNDLSRVCEPGSVEVPSLMAVETYATVHQLVSTVTGRLRPGVTAAELLRATFPGGSMTGAPKERTLEIIDSLEAGERGIYSGTIGYFAFDGTADLNIVIRTAVKRGEQLTVGAGGAIVWDSDPVAEWDEKQLKADAVVEALQCPKSSRSSR